MRSNRSNGLSITIFVRKAMIATLTSSRSSPSQGGNDRAALLRLQGQVYRETRALGGPVPLLMPWLLDRRKRKVVGYFISSASRYP